MSRKTRVSRWLGGAGAALFLLAAGFAVLIPAMHRWGATDAEVAMSLPGDGLADGSGLNWTNAVTIDAPVEQVWPWIAQIGDARGAFYSYTFIENLIAGERLYVNADRIVPEFQNPQPGDRMIDVYFVVREVEPGEYLLGASNLDLMPLPMAWVWAVYPLGEGQTRLIVRVRTGSEGGEGMRMPPVVGGVIDVTGFVMEQKMLQGIRLRAEGGKEPDWAEGVEIALWLAALGAGIGAAVLYLKRSRWGLPLAAGCLAIVWLFVLTYVQPALWLRGLGDLVLIGLVVAAGRKA